MEIDSVSVNTAPLPKNNKAERAVQKATSNDPANAGPGKSASIKLSLSEEGKSLSRQESLNFQLVDKSNRPTQEESLAEAKAFYEQFSSSVSHMTEIHKSLDQSLAKLSSKLDASKLNAFDFTVTSEGELKVISDELTEQERSLVATELNNNKRLVSAANELQNAALTAFGDDELDVDMLESTDLRGISITKDSLSETLNFRELLRNSAREIKNAVNPKLETQYSMGFTQVASMIKANLS